MRLQQAIYRAASAPRRLRAFGQAGSALAISRMLQTSVGPGGASTGVTYQEVSPSYLPLVINAVSNSWGSGPYGTAYGRPLGKGYESRLPYQPASLGGSAVLSSHQGEWIVALGDPFAEGCTPVGPQSPAGAGCYLTLYATASELEALDYLQQSGSVGSPAFVLQQGQPESSAIKDTLDHWEHEARRAALGLRWGALIGAAAALGIIILAVRR
jgi:hypothetical protein